MFWDIKDYFTDSDKQLKRKAYRRKSNYYEEKSKSLQSVLDKIKRDLEDARNNYRLNTGERHGTQENVLDFLYWEKESEMFTSTNPVISDLEYYRDEIDRKRTKASDLYDTYYRLAIKE